MSDMTIPRLSVSCPHYHGARLLPSPESGGERVATVWFQTGLGRKGNLGTVCRGMLKRTVCRPQVGIPSFSCLVGIPNRCIVVYKVEGFMPRSWAAPSGPLIRQPVFCKTPRI